MTEYTKKKLAQAIADGDWWRRFPSQSWKRVSVDGNVTLEGKGTTNAAVWLSQMFDEVETKPYIPERKLVKKTMYAPLLDIKENRIYQVGDLYKNSEEALAHSPFLGTIGFAKIECEIWEDKL